MNAEQRAARGQRAELALEEFFAPAMREAREAYLAAMTRIAANEPWESSKISKLAIAQTVIDMIDQHMRTAIMDGADASRAVEHARRIEDIPERRRTLLRSLGVTL